MLNSETSHRRALLGLFVVLAALWMIAPQIGPATALSQDPPAEGAEDEAGPTPATPEGDNGTEDVAGATDEPGDGAQGQSSDRLNLLALIRQCEWWFVENF